MASLSMNMRQICALECTEGRSKSCGTRLPKKDIKKQEREEGREGGKEERARTLTLRLSSSMTLSKLINHPETNFLRFIGRH